MAVATSSGRRPSFSRCCDGSCSSGRVRSSEWPPGLSGVVVHPSIAAESRERRAALVNCASGALVLGIEFRRRGKMLNLTQLAGGERPITNSAGNGFGATRQKHLDFTRICERVHLKISLQIVAK